MCIIINYTFFNFIVLIDEWKKQLSVQLIDYNLLDVKETIASGLNVATVCVLIFVMFKISWVLCGFIIHKVYWTLNILEMILKIYNFIKGNSC